MSRQAIFKVGNHTDSNGVSRNFTPQILSAIATGYDTQKHEAPYVVGHPTQDGPAYGWAKSLAFDEADGTLYAEDDQIEPQFAELVNSGRFKKKSASFYPPDHSGNPTPGQWYLRHVGFLGAQPPAIKGIKSASFADNAGCIEFSDWDGLTVAAIFRRIRDWMIADFGQEKADKVLPNYDIDSLQTSAARGDTPASVAYAEGISTTTGGDPVTPEEIAAKAKAAAAQAAAQSASFAEAQSKLAADQAALKAREEMIAKIEVAARRTACVDFVEGLVKEGKILPVEKPGLIEVLLAFAPETAPVEFGEGEAKKSQTPAAILSDFLKGLAKRVEFGEKAGGQILPAPPTDPKAIAELAVEFVESEAKAGRSVAIDHAVKHVMQAA